jgi:hypothetical protein
MRLARDAANEAVGNMPTATRQCYDMIHFPSRASMSTAFRFAGHKPPASHPRRCCARRSPALVVGALLGDEIHRGLMPGDLGFLVGLEERFLQLHGAAGVGGALAILQLALAVVAGQPLQIVFGLRREPDDVRWRIYLQRGFEGAFQSSFHAAFNVMSPWVDAGLRFTCRPFRSFLSR